MKPRKKLKIPDNQLRLIDIEPALSRKKNHRASRLDSLEERVTRIEGDLALLGGQLEREDDEYDYED